jgi:hypothetical protein
MDAASILLPLIILKRFPKKSNITGTSTIMPKKP